MLKQFDHLIKFISEVNRMNQVKRMIAANTYFIITDIVNLIKDLNYLKLNTNHTNTKIYNVCLNKKLFSLQLKKIKF